MAILLRTIGIPTRNVTGFVGGTYNRFGNYYAVRQGDAHSWVEVYVDGTGWQRFDPTPPSSAVPQSEITGVLAFVRDVLEAAAQRWTRHVVGYDLPQQLQILRSARRTYSELRGRSPALRLALASPRRLALLLGGLVLLAAGLYWLRRSRRGGRRSPDPRSPDQVGTLQIVSLYRSLEAALAAHGVPRQSGTPPLAHATSLHQMGHPLGSESVALTRIYLEARFGGLQLDPATRAEFARRVRALRRHRELVTTRAA